MTCQCIELDVNIIYAGMLEGDFYRNYRAVERLVLGQVLLILKDLDNSDDKLYFTTKDLRTFGRYTALSEAHARLVYKKRGRERAFEKEESRLEKEIARLQNCKSKRKKSVSVFKKNITAYKTCGAGIGRKQIRRRDFAVGYFLSL